MRFDELDLEDEILDGLEDMNFHEMTPVQEHTIPVILEGRDIIGCAQTGTGKTAAYTLPLLNKLLIEGNPDNVVKSLIIVPTRELAQQIDQQFQGFSYYAPLSTTVVYGGGDGKGWDIQKNGMLNGADVVIASATKFIGGHGTAMGGVIIDAGKFDWAGNADKFPGVAKPNPSYHGISFADAVGPAAFVTYIRAILLRDTGAAISPFNAFLLLQGTETLSLRIERHVENTKKVVEFLKNHPQVEHVNHPSLPEHPDHALYEKYFPNGGASIFTFDIKGGKDAARVFIDNLHLFSLLANVADAKSLVIHPASTTHSQETLEELEDQGIHQGTIRLSIGLENIDDIIEDLESGFKALRESGLAK